MTFPMILLIALFVISISFTVWNTFILKRHFNRLGKSFQHASTLSDQKYFELKSRQEYIIACAIFIIGGLTLLGYRSIQDVKVEIRSELKKEVDSIERQQLRVSKLLESAEQINLRAEKADLTFRTTTDKVNRILQNEIIENKTYVIKDIKFKDFPRDKYGYRTIDYQALETISGKRLPRFKKVPSIIAFSTRGGGLNFSDITTTSFKITSFTHPEFEEDYKLYSREQLDNLDHLVVDIWLTEVP